MVMRAESMDLRKLADGSGGGLPQTKIRKYTSEMASVCLLYTSDAADE